jgi:hypothetical protein
MILNQSKVLLVHVASGTENIEQERKKLGVGDRPWAKQHFP